MQIDGLDHLVLTVANIETTVGFYARVLGMAHVVRDGRHALHFGEQKINLHEAGREFEPKAAQPTPGSGDLCFITSQPLDEVSSHLAGQNVPIELGPVARTGARGAMTSLYLRDPDSNLIEISSYEDPTG